MTTDQYKIISRSSNLLRTGNFVSFMNNTKWRVLISDLLNKKVPYCKASIKYIREDIVYEPSHMNWNEITDWKFIEWVRFNVVYKKQFSRMSTPNNVDITDIYLNWLKAIKVNYEVESNYIIVYGYKKLPNKLINTGVHVRVVS